VLALALGVLLATVPPVDVPLGGGHVAFRISVEVHPAGGAPEAPPLSWRTRADGSLAGVARGSGWDAEVRLAPAEGGARVLAAEIRWRAPVALESAAVRISWPGAPRAVGRDLSLVDVERPLRVGRGTPVFVTAGAAALAGGPGFPTAWYARRPAGEAEAVLLLDDAPDHPFSVYETCLDRLPPPSPGGRVAFAALEHRRSRAATERRTGDRDAAQLTLYPVADAGAALPVVVERWPRGARAAVVFTDHADRTDPDALRAVLWGRSAPAEAGRPGAGFLGRGVRITKSFFVHARRGGLDDPETHPLAMAIAAAGSEVALHSITGERDDRQTVREGLAAASPFQPVTWIDHEPYTNCEAVSSEGWRDDGRYGIRDLLVAAGVRWLWAAGDVGGFTGARVVDVFGGDPGAARPAIYPLPVDPRLWVFESSFFYAPPAELAAALSDGALEALERARGLFVAHTYLAAGPATTHLPDQLARLAVHPDPAGGLALDPDLDAALGRIAARVKAGTLASLTWAEAGDRLRALGDVAVVYREDGTAELRNLGDTRIEGLTFAIPEEGLELTVDGVPVSDRADAPGWTRAWLDLAPGARVVLAASRGLVPVPFLPR
jgi:hypothetical protein